MFLYMKKKNYLFVLLLLFLVVSAIVGYYETTDSMSKNHQKRVIHMSAIEPKGSASIDKEPFPETVLPEGNGYKLTEPDEEGRWESSTYRWEPGLIVAYEGEEVELQIWGVNGSIHHSTIEGYDQDFVVERGKLTKVNFKADKTGLFSIVCHDHLPAMQSQLLILPNE